MVMRRVTAVGRDGGQVAGYQGRRRRRGSGRGRAHCARGWRLRHHPGDGHWQQLRSSCWSARAGSPSSPGSPAPAPPPPPAAPHRTAADGEFRQGLVHPVRRAAHRAADGPMDPWTHGPGEPPRYPPDYDLPVQHGVSGAGRRPRPRPRLRETARRRHRPLGPRPRTCSSALNSPRHERDLDRLAHGPARRSPCPTPRLPLIRFRSSSAIDAEEFYDYVLAHSPEFAAGRKAAEKRFARGEYGKPLDHVIAELDAEDTSGATRARDPD